MGNRGDDAGDTSFFEDRVVSSRWSSRDFYLVYFLFLPSLSLFFRYRFWIFLFLVPLSFFIFLSFFISFYLHSIGSSLLVSRRVGSDASGKDRVMQRMGIVRWFEYLSLHFFFPLLPFSFRLPGNVCDREESVVLIKF